MEKIMIPPLDSNAAEVIKNNWAKMDKPLHSLGKLEEMVEKYAAMTGTALPDKIKSAMLLMCGDHGIAKYGVSASAGSNYADDKRLHEGNCRR